MLLASFLGFLLLFLLIGFSSVLVRSKEQSDYLLAGSSVPPSLIGLSAVATNNSGFMFIGVIGYTYATGLPAFTMMVGWILGDWMAATLVTRCCCWESTRRPSSRPAVRRCRRCSTGICAPAPSSAR